MILNMILYPVQDSAESGLIFSKYWFFEYFWDPK